jgi:hypothetical protein
MDWSIVSIVTSIVASFVASWLFGWFYFYKGQRTCLKVEKIYWANAQIGGDGHTFIDGRTWPILMVDILNSGTQPASPTVSFWIQESVHDSKTGKVTPRGRSYHLLSRTVIYGGHTVTGRLDPKTAFNFSEDYVQLLQRILVTADEELGVRLELGWGVHRGFAVSDADLKMIKSGLLRWTQDHPLLWNQRDKWDLWSQRSLS